MKKYTRTQEVRAIRWTGNNQNEIREVLGDRFYTSEGWEPGKGNSLAVHNIRSNTCRGVFENAWIVMDSSNICGITVVSNEDFKKQFVEIKK